MDPNNPFDRYRRSRTINYGSDHGNFRGRKLKMVDHSVSLPDPGVIAPTLPKKSATVDHEDHSSVKRSIQRRHVYKAGDRRGDRNSLRVVDRHSIDHRFDYSDGHIQAIKSAPGSGRSSPPDILSLSLAGQRAWSPGSGMTSQPIEAKVVILGAQGEWSCVCSIHCEC